MKGRLAFVTLLTTSLLVGGVAQAAWLATGTGTGQANAGTIVAPASATASASGSTVTVSWPAAAGAPTGASYVVTRSPAGGTCGATATTTCTDTGVADGSYTYTVRTVAGTNWSSNGTTSNSVTIDTAPPAATTFSIAGLADSADRPTTGVNWTPRTTVTVRDNNGDLVSGAVVTFSWSAKKGKESTLSGDTSCTTDATGTCVADTGSIPKQYTPAVLTLTGASQGTLTYNSAGNAANSISLPYDPAA